MAFMLVVMHPNSGKAIDKLPGETKLLGSMANNLAFRSVFIQGSVELLLPEGM